MQRPVVTGESLTVDKGEEDEAMAQMVCDNFIEHEDDGDDYAHQFCEPMCLALKQVKLEVSAASSSLPQQKEVPSDTKIKVEPDESPHLSNGHASGLINGVEAATTVDDKTSVPMTPANRAAATTAGDVLSQDKNTMLLFQLPQTLPSIVSGEGSHARLQPGTSSALDTEEEEGKKKAEYCRLRDLPSGQIGCVKIYKSGRAELCLGNYALPINVGCQQDFLQEVAHVSIDETRKSGKMAVLGRVDRRLLVSPSFSSLLESSRSKR
ncbi:DNA-directed RNA polymerase III subunit rpc4 [Hyalella azteca]|uniref:DNA-directed RNA polymerase III subunit rpc4 n=1 Tax=Hyalella azteca TaxID=294128 RepID=A0A8B7NH10_HYAAZ|nr:DNA-directed RNA polymerase III subunit rpc4 [Hyalella azteca]